MDVRSARPSEYDEVVEVVRAAFSADDPAARVLTTAIQYDPKFRSEYLRVVSQSGQIVGVVHLIDRFVRIGTAQVRCAIVAPLAVARPHRGKGIGSALMRNSLEWARREGFDLSMLWGHTWLYPRYGYAPGIKHYEVLVSGSLHPVGGSAYALRPATAADAPALMQVYHAETALATLAELRSDEPWEWRAYSSDTAVDVAVDPAGAVRGYMRVTTGVNTLQVGELYAMDNGAAQALYDRLIHLGRERQAVEVRVTATPENRWSRLAFAQGAKVCVSSGSSAGMVRVLDWPGLLKTIRPELERRVQRSEFVTGRTQVQIETPVGRGTILIEQGQVTLGDARSESAVTLPFHALAPLLTGYLPFGELKALTGVFVHGRGVDRLVDLLFPEGLPHWSLAAYFN